MPWNGNGTFSRLYSWVADAAAGIDISSTRTDADTDDITTNGFGNCLTRDGQGIATANLPMGGFRHINCGAGVAATDYATMGQLQVGLTQWAVGAGTGDAITATYNPPIASLSDGTTLYVRAPGTNVSTVPTFAPNGITAETIQKIGGTPLVPGDIVQYYEMILRWNNGLGTWIFMNPPPHVVGEPIPWAGTSIPSGYVNATGQNLSQTTYPALFTQFGTTYGNPGGGNFTMPDWRGRILPGIDQGTNRISGYFANTLGATGGAQNQAISIAQANLPSTNFSSAGFSIADPGHNHSINDPQHYHTVADPGHSHGVGDPGHAHSVSQGALVGGQVATYAGAPGTGITSQGGQNTSTNASNVSVDGAYANIGNDNYSPSYTSNNASGVGIGLNTGYASSGGSGTALTIPTVMPGQCVYWICRAA